MSYFNNLINSINDNTLFPALDTRNGEDDIVNQYEPDLNALRKANLYRDVADHNYSFVKEAREVADRFDPSKNPEEFRPYLRLVQSTKGEFYSFPSDNDLDYRKSQMDKAQQKVLKIEAEIASAGCSTNVEPTPEHEVLENKYTLHYNDVDSNNTIDSLVTQYSYWMQRKFKLQMQIALMQDGIGKIEFTSYVKSKNGSELWVIPKASDKDYIDAKLAELQSKIEEYTAAYRIKEDCPF